MPINIAVDVMGGDFAPSAILDGVHQFLAQDTTGAHLQLVGQETLIRDYFAKTEFAGDARIEIYDAPEVVGMEEHPVHALRNKRHSSIAVSVDLVKEGKSDGLFSAGNTGASVASAFLRWRMLKGISRPGIATLIPTEKDHFLLLDAGATVDCTAVMLQHFAIMGTVYMETIRGRKNPRVGLLSNGTEETKGNKLVQETFALLQKTPGINFIGNIEGHDLFTGDVDVVVCDGFVGNVVLKNTEALAKAIGHLLKSSMKKNPLWMLGGLLSKGAFGALKKKMDYSEIGGAPLLGVNGICMIGHGISDAKATCNGIRAAVEMVVQNLNGKIEEAAAAVSGEKETAE